MRAVTGAPPIIVTRFEIDPEYEQAIREICPDAEALDTLPGFVERLHTYEPSDRLLLADSACFPLEAQDAALARLSQSDEPRGVQHLVAVQRGGEGTKEYVDSDSSGRIRSIQRYYDAVTWPFAGGIACSMVPVACLRVSFELPLASLPRLRRVLASEGVPSSDISLEGGAVNLASEQGLLALNERMVLELVRGGPTLQGRRSSTYAAPGVRVHSSASLVGPVVLQAGAQIGEGVTIIGPTVVGRRARVEAGATLAQCVIGSDQVVEAGLTLRHRAFLGAPEDTPPRPRSQAEIPDWAVPEDWETPPLGSSPESADRPVYMLVKRAIDATLAAAGLVLFAPLGLLIAALIKLESKGPIHFGHVREGMGGRPFRCWKYRTMITGSRSAAAKARPDEPDGRPPVQGPERPAAHTHGPVPVRHEPRRDPPAVERAGRGDEPRRPPAFALPREPGLRSLARGSTVRAPRTSPACGRSAATTATRATSTSGSTTTCSTCGTCRCGWT